MQLLVTTYPFYVIISFMHSVRCVHPSPPFDIDSEYISVFFASFSIFTNMSRSVFSTLRPVLGQKATVAPFALSLRHASSSSSPLSAPKEPTSFHTQPSHSTPTGPLPLSWPSYLSLRRQRRLWSTLTSVPTTFLGLFLGGGYFASLEADPSQLIFGVEPM